MFLVEGTRYTARCYRKSQNICYGMFGSTRREIKLALKGTDSCISQHTQRSEGNLWESFLFFDHGGPRDQTQLISLGGKCLKPLGLLSGPKEIGFDRQEMNSVT